MGDEPLGAVLKGKDSYPRVERGMLKFQVTHSIAVLGQTTQSNGKKKERKEKHVGKQDCVRYRRGKRHPCVGVRKCITVTTQLPQTDRTIPGTPDHVKGLHTKP